MRLEPATLDNRFVRLEPLEDHHREPLRAACDADPDLWPSLYSMSLGGEQFEAGWATLREQQARGWRIPFAVVQDHEVVGITTYLDIQPGNRAVEIGTTYYRPSARGGAVNPAAKRLLLAHAFDGGAGRVAFQVDAINARSRAAMTKLGAVEEGLHRHDKITWTGRIRSTVVFSILPDEWPGVRDRLDARLAAFG
jgi:RimJ/RimL family protein N-acetyltransferase